MINIIVPMGLSYLSGSLPSAFIIVRLLYKKNIYELGSGNGGATNVLRSFGKIPGILVLLLDFMKGWLLLFIAQKYIPSQFILYMMTIMAFLGHTFPVWTGFKGGKGVAVTAGCIGALFPVAIPVCLSVFIVTVIVSGYVSLASMVTALSLPLFFGFRQFINPSGDFIITEIFFIALFLLVIAGHRKNILRLIHGQEPKWKERFNKGKDL